MSLALIRQRIADSCPAFAGRIEACKDIDSAVEYVVSRSGGSPCMAIMDPRETASANERAIGSSVFQLVTLQFSLLICVRYAGNSAKAFDELDGIQPSVRSAMLGWTALSPDGYPVEFVRSALAINDSDVGVLIHEEDFRTQYTITA